MDYRAIMASGWRSANQCDRLKWLIFIPSFVAVFIFVVELIWQSYLYLGEFGMIEQTLTIEKVSEILGFLVSNNMIGWFIFGIIFLILFIFIVPSWLQGVLITTLHQRAEHPEKKCLMRDNILKGFDYFFPLFELHAIKSLFSAWSIALFVATFYRYFHDSWFIFLKPIFVLYFIFAVIFTIFLAFAPYFIVCRGSTVSVGIRKSVGMVFRNFRSTLTMFFLMFLVGLRVVLNVVLILGIPIFVLAAFSFWTVSVAVVASIVFSFFVLCLVAYLAAILETFSRAFWVHGFLELEENEKHSA